MHNPGDATAAVICGIGAALPSRVVSNAELCTRLDTTDEWIRSRTGISFRHVTGADSSTEDLAVQAAEQALAVAGATSVEAVVLATTTPDRCCPAAAPAVASRLGLTGVPAIDLAAGCTGFLYGLATAVGFISSRTANAVLIIGVDRLSTLPARDDRTTVPLFGDGAGAMVLRRGRLEDDGAIGPVVLGSDGTQAELIQAAHPGSLQMQGAEVFRHAVDRMTSACAQAVAAVGWCMNDIDRLVPHQANARITSFVARQLEVPDSRVLGNVDLVGNTGAASIPLLLAQSASDDRLQAGQRVLLTAFGAGLTWGAVTLTWPELAS
ncbi:beta-ketoacyl-ACP synthase 3 [Streptomyces fulvorobeus]|nr:beta-ketoacyl-ACP synthase 3 [Streptomyces fulvorobeus]GFM96926.1 3-oxoacyl-[acyl-carrier-protein] synthase 3 [Streptomyces fulvorobeus]